MTGMFDTLSSPDEIQFGNWRLIKNAVTRSTRNRQRGGGWRRLFADDSPYNNEDLHDQLVDRLGYYDSYLGHASSGGGLSGYGYPYQAPSYDTPDVTVFPAASGPYCPVYIGDFPSGLYNGCPIFYPAVGYPYNLVPGNISMSSARAHWQMDSVSGTTPDLFGGLPLTNFGVTVVDGLLGNALMFDSAKWLLSSDSAFQCGDIKFGYTGWIYRNEAGSGTQLVLGRWGSAGNRNYRLVIVADQLRFDVSSNGTLIASVTHAATIPLNTMTFFAVWHDPVLNTINLKVNNSTTDSTAHSTGVSVVGVSNFTMGLDEEFSLTGLKVSMDSVTFWKNGFPTEAELSGIYNSAIGLDYPFSSDACDTGFPFYYVYSFLYASCPTVYDGAFISGYPYGPQFPIYSPVFSYDYIYCGNQLHLRQGCREAVTLLDEIVTASGRKLIAATMSRVYEFNQSSGSWRVLIDGLGNSGYTAEQCTCNDIRGMSDTMGSYFLFTNNFDAPLYYILGDPNAGCAVSAMNPILDLAALNITKAGGVVVWKGFAIFYDITEDGERKGGKVIWSDLENPLSFIESDTSFAGSQTVALGETILNAAPIGNWLILYTDKSIIRVTLVGGEDVFNFERIYQGGDAMKFKFSLINTGAHHLYASNSDILVFTQFDTRPINVGWITKAAGFMFNGIFEDDATYEPVNMEACDLVTGGWSEEKQEAFMSWPTGENICPNVTLRLNMKYNTADLVDHGFTSFLTYYKDDRPTVGQWLEDMGICPRGSKVAVGFKDGEVCTGAESEVANPPLYIRNETEDPDLPIHERSLCAILGGQTLDDFCRDCAVAATFIAASAEDFTLKQLEDDIYYREMLGGNIEDYDGYACHGQYYTFEGYNTVFQDGSESYRSTDEKMIKRVQIEAEPLPQSSPSPIDCEVAYGAQPSCMTWVGTRPLDFECQSAKTAAQHAADGTRPDGVFNYPTWRRGQYLSVRFRISGIGGGGTFSGLHKLIKGWGQAESP